MQRVFIGLSILFVLLSNPAQAIVRYEVWPHSTNSGSSDIRGPHLVYHPMSAPNGKLLITLGGTNSLPTDFQHVHRLAQEVGYHVLALDYPNTVSTRACAEERDSSGSHYTVDCFDTYRGEIVFGGDINPLVSVDKKNSIMYRIESLLHNQRSRDESWKQFFEGENVSWQNIVLLGHSQGAGHAAYLAKFHRVHRVILFGGPQDSSEESLAPWLSMQSATPPSRYFALLHHKDVYFQQGIQQPAVHALLDWDLTLFKQNVSVLTSPTDNGHMSMLNPSMEKEWRRLLSN